MSNFIKKIKAYLRLIRAHTVIATALTPSLGAFATFSILEGELLPWNKIPIIITLFMVGVIVHVFGEILNDYMDFEIDKSSIELKDKPLVSGDISKNGALVSLIIVFAFLIVIIAFSEFTVFSLILLAFASSTGILYQLISKKWLHSAVFLGLYAFFIILFGAAYAGKYIDLFSIPALVYIIAILGFFQLWTNTAILGHLKDLKNDAKCGVETFPMRFGVKVKGDGKTPKLIIPMGFRVLVLIIQLINLIIAFIPLILLNRFYPGEVNILLLSLGLILVSLIMMASQIKVMFFKIFERNKLMRLMAVREIGAYLLAIILLSPFMGWLLALIYIFLPFTWFVIINRIFTGKSMQAAI